MDWLYTQFKDWAILYYATIAHNQEKDAREAEFYREVIAAYDSNVPSFHLEIVDKIPVMVWDFHSLMAVIHLVFGLLVTDDKRPLRSCKYCNRAFIVQLFKPTKCVNKQSSSVVAKPPSYAPKIARYLHTFKFNFTIMSKF